MIRSDFVQVLMQLGLALLEAGDPNQEADPSSTATGLNATALRERQLSQLQKVRGPRDSGARHRRERERYSGPFGGVENGVDH